jgi:hypothetical protein
LCVTVEVFPATSVAVTLNVLGPTVAVLILEPLATVPTQLATPEAGGATPSEQLKLDATDDMRIGVALSTGAVIATVGFTVSILTIAGIRDEPPAAPALPAPSVALQLKLCVPSAVKLRLPLAVVVPTPIRLSVMALDVPLTVSTQLIAVTVDGSVADTPTVTGLAVNQPRAFGVGTVSVTTGGVTSLTVIDTVADLALVGSTSFTVYVNVSVPKKPGTGV